MGGGGVTAKIQNLAFCSIFGVLLSRGLIFLKICFVILSAGIKKYSAP